MNPPDIITPVKSANTLPVASDGECRGSAYLRGGGRRRGEELGRVGRQVYVRRRVFGLLVKLHVIGNEAARIRRRGQAVRSFNELLKSMIDIEAEQHDAFGFHQQAGTNLCVTIG